MMMMSKLKILFVVFLAFPVLSAKADDIDDCSQMKNLNSQIRGCSNIINDSRYSKSNRAMAHGNRGNAYDMKGDRNRAIADYGISIDLNPDHATTYYNRGIAYAHKRQYRRAIADYNKAIRLRPKFGDAYYNRGFAYRKLGDYRRARSDEGMARRFK